MKTNLFNTIEEYKAPECKTLEILLEESVLQTGSPKFGSAGAAGADGEWAPLSPNNNGGDF